jgi:hypothetical protein
MKLLVVAATIAFAPTRRPTQAPMAAVTERPLISLSCEPAATSALCAGELMETPIPHFIVFK